MKRKKLLFLVNPHAGKSEIRHKLLEIVDLFVRHGWEVTVHTTQRPLEIPKLVKRRAKRYELVVCCGGDGTLNETVAGLMACDPRPMLGYIPAGTVNDFASSLGLSKNMPEAARAIMEGVPFCCDIGGFNDRYFTYIAAFGAFTDVAYQTPQQTKNVLGRAAYILEGIRRLPSIKAYRLTVEHDGGRVEGDFLFGMVTNSRSVGGFRLAGKIDVSMNDGLLEVLLVRNPTNPMEAQQVITAILGQQFDSELILCFRTTAVTFCSAEEVPWTLDGEFGGAVCRAEIVNHPRALQVLTDPGALPA